MLRMETPFQIDRPVFARIKFDSHGKTFRPGDVYPWKEMSINTDKVIIMYRERQIHHNAALEAKMPNVGDGLDTMNIESLHDIVNSINEKVRKFTNSEKEFGAKKCKTSKIPDKQRGLIRQWRRGPNSKMETL